MSELSPPHETTVGVMRGVVRYDGSRFHGWSAQPGVRTVQGELEQGLSKIFHRRVRIQGASRTDQGVHALGQVFSFRSGPCDPERVRHALSCMFRPDIRVTELGWTTPDFNARFSARGKRYAYSIHFSREPDPFLARYVWTVPYEVDLDCIRRLLKDAEGTHDFRAFAGASEESRVHPPEGSARGTACTMHALRLLRGGTVSTPEVQNVWRIEVVGNFFLYHMVRNLVGTVVDIARGRFPETLWYELLHVGGVFRGHCAPPQGLMLMEVFYDDAALHDAVLRVKAGSG